MGSSISSVLDPDSGEATVPEGYQTPSFPSLYLPSLINTKTERGLFLYEAEAIWRFTLYWTISLLGGIFLICALLACLTFSLSLTVYRRNAFPPEPPPPIPIPDPNGPPARPAPARKVEKRKRPPFWPLIVLPLVAAAVAVLVALISGTVVGFALAAVYAAGGFSMSTWVPFLWALIQVLVVIISSYSTLTSIL